MSRYIIHRDIPGVGSFSPQEYQAAERKSDEVMIFEHSECSGFPANIVREITVVGPVTAEGA